MPEVWRTVAECDRYEVSNLGNVRHKKRGKTLRPSLRHGYPYIQLGDPSRKRNIHQLVCAAFHGPRPDGCYACHRNDVKTDNRAENLYWGTPQQNADDAVGNGRIVRGEAVNNAKLTWSEVEEMRELYAEGNISYRELAERYGVTKRTALLAVTGATWWSSD